MSDRYCTIQLSRDGANTWGEHSHHSLGDEGAHQTRVTRRRCGISRQWVVRIEVSSPIKRDLLAISAQIEQE